MLPQQLLTAMYTLHNDKRQYLKLLLQNLGKYHGSYAHFARLLSKKTAVNYHRNLVNRILADEIKFDRSLHEHLDKAIEVAQHLQKQYDAARKKILSSIPLHQLIDRQQNADLLHEQLLKIDQEAEAGAYLQGAFVMDVLTTILDLKKLHQYSPYHEGLLYLIAAKIKLQLGPTPKAQDGLILARRAASIFGNLKEYELYQKVQNLQGNLLRQAGDYEGALLIFQNNSELVKAHPHIWPKPAMLLQKNEHQQAVTLMRSGHNEGRPEQLAVASQLFTSTNAYFADETPEDWTKHTCIREAEAAVKGNQLSLAEKLLLPYENLHQVSLLRDPQKVILFRTVAAYYFQIGDKKKGHSYAQTALQLAVREGYEHEIKQIKELLQLYF